MSKLFQTNKNSEEENKMSKDLVFIQNDQVLTDSRVVAAKFGKEHKNVIRDIENLLDKMASVSQSSNLRSANDMFFKSSYQAEEGGRNYPMYFMNRDGFTLLAMGFTGEEAVRWKLKYIAAFNAMESELKKQHEQPKQKSVEYPELPSTRALLDVQQSAKIMSELFGVKEGIALAKAISNVEKLQGVELSEMRSLIPSTIDETGTFNPTQIGEKVGISNRRVNKLLRDLGYQYKENDEWFLTEFGKKYGEKFPYENNGHSGYQIRWNEEVVDKIKECL